MDGVDALGTLIARLDATDVRGDHRARPRPLRARGRGRRGAGGRPRRAGSTPPRSGGRRWPSSTPHRLRPPGRSSATRSTAIAGEKAAIIRSGRGRSRRAQEPEARGGHRAPRRARPACRCCSRGATCASPSRGVAPRRPAARPARARAGGSTTSRCGLLGVYQPGNALLAAAAARALGAGEARDPRGPRAARAGPAASRCCRARRRWSSWTAPTTRRGPGRSPPRCARTSRRGAVTLRDRRLRRQGRARHPAPRSRPLAARVILTAAANPRARRRPRRCRGPAARGALRGRASRPSVARGAGPRARRARARPIVCVAGSLFADRRASWPTAGDGRYPLPGRKPLLAWALMSPTPAPDHSMSGPAACARRCSSLPCSRPGSARRRAPARPGPSRAPRHGPHGGRRSDRASPTSIEQVGGPTDLLIATGNVEITRGPPALLADRVEINRDTGEAVAAGPRGLLRRRGSADRRAHRLQPQDRHRRRLQRPTRVAAPYYRISGERMDRLGESVYRGAARRLHHLRGRRPAAWSFRFGDGHRRPRRLRLRHATPRSG